ncbi:transporter substrate-binding domain-containing diguanylate cyclase [Marinobacterium sediminicola]|uniref:transporter substrate-binding domain-containing diguanylate cyclase n=1 Tax=Marinobacterium sediminicola TaxID=518898 RepID=UPI001EF03988|nr:transporter substrate-binding domain-containing protein [Marinobacterium sediminicola]ULG70426.1 transporter substrate-binding domain-containing protein [Marinobacterium sediminicola]
MTLITRALSVTLFLLLSLVQTAWASLALSPEEQSLVDAKQPIHVAVMYDFVPFSYVEDGTHKGFVADLLQLIEAKTGAKLKARVGEWSNNLENLRHKQVDAIADVSFKPERTSFILYTTPYFEIPTVVFTDKQFGDYQGLADLSGKHVGVLRNIFYIRELRKRRDIRISEYDDYESLTRALAFGEIDAAIQNLTSGYHYATQNAYTNIKMAAEFRLDNVGREDLRFGVRTDKPVIQSLLQKGLDSITEAEWSQLTNRWVGTRSSELVDRRQTVALSIKEREFVRQNPVIRVHNEANFEPFSFYEDDQPVGHSVDFIRMLAQRVGLKVEFVSGHSWNDYLEMMRNGQLDVMTNIVHSPERAQYMHFTTPYLRLAQGIFRRQDSAPITSAQQLQSRRLVLPEGFYTYEQLSRKEGFRVEPAKDSLEALMRVSTGTEEVTIEIMRVAEHLLQKYGIPGVAGSAPHQVIAADPLSLRLAITRNKPLLKQILQKAMDSLTEQEKRQVLHKWTGKGAQASNFIHLTGQELGWMESRAAIRVCSTRQRLPYEDMISSNGNHIGVFAELLDIMRHNAGLSVRLVSVANFREALGRLKRGECDLISRTPPGFADPGISLSQPLLEGTLVIATGLDEVYVRNFSQLEPYMLAVVEGSHVQLYLERHHAELKLKPYPDLADAMKAVAAGKVFGLVDTLPVISRAIVTDHHSDIKISGELEADYPALLATRSDDALLLQIVNKAIQSIGTEQFETVTNRWMQAPILAEPPDYRLITQVALATLFVVALILIWNRKLAHLNARIHESRNELMTAHEELKIKNRMLEQLSTTDRLTRLKNRLYLERAFEQQLLQAEQDSTYTFSLLLVDIDHFKRINDGFGHDQGDAVLTDFAAVLKGTSREQDVIARWGGEEFMLICPNTDLRAATELAERLLKALRGHHFAEVGHCTASIGVATWTSGDSYKSLCRRADQALYHAKHSGRDQVSQQGASTVSEAQRSSSTALV